MAKRDESPSVTIPMSSEVAAFYVVYFPRTWSAPPGIPDFGRAAALWRQKHLRSPLQEAVAKLQESGLISVRIESAESLPAPPLDVLRYTGLGELEERVISAATQVVLVSCGDPNTAPRIGLWSTLALALAIAEELNGVVFDPEAMRIVKRDSGIAWFGPTGAIAASQHIIVPFSVGRSGLGWMTTRGLGKFGLPDLELRDVPPNLDKLTILMNAIGQFLIETALDRTLETKGRAAEITVPGEITVDGTLVARAHARADESQATATPPVTVGLRFDPAGASPPPAMVQIVPPRGSISEPSVWLNAILERLVGSSRLSRRVRTGDDAMMEAHERATAELPYAKQRFEAGLQPGEVLYVKRGFETSSGSREFLWLAVTRWTADHVVGQLANQPDDVPGLRLGQTVTVAEAEIFDWMIQMPDDRSEGGYTSAVALQQGEP